MVKKLLVTFFQFLEPFMLLFQPSRLFNYLSLFFYTDNLTSFTFHPLFFPFLQLLRKPSLKPFLSDFNPDGSKPGSRDLPARAHVEVENVKVEADHRGRVGHSRRDLAERPHETLTGVGTSLSGVTARVPNGYAQPPAHPPSARTPTVVLAGNGRPPRAKIRLLEQRLGRKVATEAYGNP